MPTLKRYLYYFAVILVHAGSAFVTTCGTSLVVPIATSQLKMEANSANFIFGGVMSIVNFFLQIIAGVISDNSTSKFGRRKTFIVPGAIIACLGMILMGYSKLFGILFGDNDNLVFDDNETSTSIFSSFSFSFSETSNSGLGHYVFHPFGFLFCLAGSVTMSIGNAFYGVCARAIISDVIPFEEQQTVQFLNMVTANVSYCIYYFSCAIMAETEWFYYVVFAIGITVVIITTTITTIFVKEEQYQPEKKNETCSSCKNCGDAFCHIPKKVLVLIFLLFVSALSISPYSLNINNYVGENYYNGDAHMNDDQFKKGIKMNNYAQAVACICGCIAAMIFPFVSKGKEVLFYIGSNILTTVTVVIYVVLNYCDDNVGDASAGVVAGLFITTIFNQIASVATQSVPWAFFKKVSPAKHMGVYSGMMMSVYLVSGVASSLVTSALLSIYDDLVYVFIYQIVVLVIMCGCSFLLFYVQKEKKNGSDYQYDGLQSDITETTENANADNAKKGDYDLLLSKSTE